MANNVYLITTNSGTTILTCVVHEDDDKYLLKDPLELHFDLSTPGVEQFFVTRWNAFSENYVVLLYKTSIESLTICSEKFKEVYNKRVDKLRAIKAQIEDSDETTVTEMDDFSEEPSSDEGDDGDDTPITYH